MPYFRDTPIKLKLLWVTLTTCGTALALACGALFWFQSVNFRKSFVAELQSLGAVVAQNSAAPLSFKDDKSALEVLSALKVKPHITSATVFDADGKVFAHIGDDQPSPGIQEGSHETTQSVIFDGSYAMLDLPVEWDGNLIGYLHLRAQFSKEYRKLLSLYAMVLAAVLVGSLVVIVIVTSVMQSIITVPIASLATVASKVSEEEDYASRAAEGGKDEVGLLTRAFNQMLDQIQSRDHRLRESQQRYEVAVMGSSDGLWDWDLAAQKIYYSPRWKNILGFADEEIPNRIVEWENRLHPEDRKATNDRIKEYLDGKTQSFEVEFRMLHKDGSYRWILSRGAALWDATGTPFRFAGSHTDITERKKAEQELYLARQKFETLINSIPGIVWEADPVTDQMLFVSDQSGSILGYPASRWLEDSSFRENHIHPDDRKVTIDHYHREVANGKAHHLEYRFLAADDRIVWLRESISVEVKHGKPTRVNGVAIDITEQKLAAEQITRMQRELVEASRVAGMAEVATGVLHNVGNVLNSVNVSATLIVEQLRKSKTASLSKLVHLLRQHTQDLGEFLACDPKGVQVPAFLEAIAEQLAWEQGNLAREAQSLQQNVEHIKQIVAMQQSYAKVSGARENFSLVEMVDDALRMSSAALTRHHIEVVREFEIVPPVMVDRHLVLQILVNLISNAQHALDCRPEGRRLILRIKNAEKNVRLEVVDNGAGIARENLTRVFQHGFTTKKTGHGFGLHSGANAAREMGGSISVQSDGLGCGATFILELPQGDSMNQRPASNLAQTARRTNRVAI